MEQNQPSSLFEMEIDPAAQTHLATISKWSRFIGIVGLVFAGLGLLGIISSGGKIMYSLTSYTFGNFSSAIAIIVVLFLVICILGACWIYFLLRASTLVRRALVTRNSNELAEAFKALKNFFTISIVFSVMSLLNILFTFVN